MPQDKLSRRSFLRFVGVGAAIGLVTRQAGGQQPDSLSGRGQTGTLRDPWSVGRPRDTVTMGDNDLTIQAIEHKLKCSCGCNLDIFTCRTTDFSCEVSPRLHRQVLGLFRQGMNEQQILQTFVAEYGEQALMAPRPEGFNLAGYVVPGAAILVAGTLLALYLNRRRSVAAAQGPAVPVASERSMAATKATSEELERLRRAITQDEE